MRFWILKLLRCCSKVKENVTLTTKEKKRLRERWVETMIPESY